MNRIAFQPADSLKGTRQDMGKIDIQESSNLNLDLMDEEDIHGG